ncbi:hypothetical protein CYLTODRAFT_465371 [Cylindrobasidium torrendii FP15055 ss-10]|uniref:YCII-related domain-containing protein n=1 Tax=Cylindrobasidium torrendii FP15055 ss-10 TaxID=1314674 RepID=A0A0D7B4Q3_9AGAR|nr:hypothetical protein CYLTODRAFT_465371 [Cylindrobasidium torrendii FP15055 ss-10]
MLVRTFTPFRTLRGTFSRTLSTYIVYAPDSATGDRLAVREQHLKAIRPSIDAGIVRVAGMMLDPKTEREPYGSMLLVDAPDMKTVRALVEGDIYWKTGVWDKEKLTITPIKLATPLPELPE